MKSFSDAAGRTWLLRITIGAVERVKDEIDGKPDLLALADGTPSLATQLETGPALLCHVVFALLKPQADKLGLGDADFCEAIDAATFAAAAEAFWGELCDFFQTLGRNDLVRLIEAQHQVLQRTVERNVTQVAANLDKLLTGPSTPGSTSGDSPESADSIRAP